jgi:hypothetical protein
VHSDNPRDYFCFNKIRCFPSIHVIIIFSFCFRFSFSIMNTTNYTFSKVTILFDYKLKLVEQIVLASIFIFALIGNTLVLILMINKRHRRMTRMSFFILHLTIADLLVAFLSVLPMLIWKSTITFNGGDFLCRLIVFLMLTVSYISVYT